MIGFKYWLRNCFSYDIFFFFVWCDGEGYLFVNVLSDLLIIMIYKNSNKILVFMFCVECVRKLLFENSIF